MGEKKGIACFPGSCFQVSDHVLWGSLSPSNKRRAGSTSNSVIQVILLPPGFFSCRCIFWELGSCKILPRPSPSEGPKLHRHSGEEMVSGCSFHLGFWSASKLTQPLKKIKESQHEIVFYRTTSEQPQIIITLLYFVHPFLPPAPVFYFCFIPSTSIHFPLPQAKMTTVEDLHSCNDITLQRNGYFSLNALSALRELRLLSQNAQRRVYGASSALMSICRVSGSHLASEVVFLQT